MQTEQKCAEMFYDIDTPVTLAKLARGDYDYISPSLIPCTSCFVRPGSSAGIAR